MGLRVIGQVCKKLRELIHYGDVTHMGLIALVQGCINLEYLDVTLSNISNEAIECVGTHLKNLRVFRMTMFKFKKASIDNGIRAMLKGCIKLKRLSLWLGDEGLTDVGLGYIGKYGHNLTYLHLNCKGVSDAGLLKLSSGCPKLRKLNLWDCRFSEQAVATVFNIHSLRYIWVEDALGTILALTRPKFTAEVSIYHKPWKITEHWIRYTFWAIGISLFSVWLMRHTRLSSIVDNWVLAAKKIFSNKQALKAARDEYLEKMRNRQKEQVQSTSDERHSQDAEDGIEDTLGNFTTCST